MKRRNAIYVSKRDRKPVTPFHVLLPSRLSTVTPFRRDAFPRAVRLWCEPIKASSPSATPWRRYASTRGVTPFRESAKRVAAERDRGDLEIWPGNRPPRPRQSTEEKKSVWKDPGRGPPIGRGPRYGQVWSKIADFRGFRPPRNAFRLPVAPHST